MVRVSSCPRGHASRPVDYLIYRTEWIKCRNTSVLVCVSLVKLLGSIFIDPLRQKISSMVNMNKHAPSIMNVY